MVAYCSPNSLQKEVTQPLVQIRHRGSLINDLEAIDWPQIIPDLPDQIKSKKAVRLPKRATRLPPLPKAVS